MGAKNSKNYYYYVEHHRHIYEAPEQPSNHELSPGYGSASTTSSPPYFCPLNNRAIGDEFDSLEQVSQALEKAGLESSNLIIGIDFTKSNEWTGKKSFEGKNLHHLGVGDCLNPYEQAISIIGRTLSKFDDDNKIPCYGFGDATTGDREVFSFQLEDQPCDGFENVLSCYREIVPRVKLAGPTSYAPIIRNAIRIVNDSGGRYHVLLIIADGQVTRSVDTPNELRSLQEERTMAAIVEASEYPLSIVLVGVGDGPWDQMHKYDDNIPDRVFDNVQFVNFTEIMLKDIPQSRKETEFALKSLMEIPFQYKATQRLQPLSYQGRQFPVPLPPPVPNVSLNSSPSCRRTDNIRQMPAAFGFPTSSLEASSSSLSSSSSSFNRICPECFRKDRDCVFGCGHQTCYDCGQVLNSCPTCQKR